MLNEAAQIVRKHYPGARFLEADINYELFGSGWRFVFDVPATRQPAGQVDTADRIAPSGSLQSARPILSQAKTGMRSAGRQGSGRSSRPREWAR
jgi:hypothetical protein